jgi:hypothetical protein
LLIIGGNGYLVQNMSIAGPPGTGSSISTSANCQSVDFVINGGYELDNAISSINYITLNDSPITFGAHAGNTWETTIVHAKEALVLLVEAYCYDNSP